MKICVWCIVLIAISIQHCTCAFLDCDVSEVDFDSGDIPDPQDICDFRAYGTRLSIRVGICLIIALFLIICCPLWFCGRACNCCGGRGQHPGCCCPNTEVKKTYTKHEVIGVKCGNISAVVLTAVGLLVGLIGSTQLWHSIDKSFDSVDVSIDRVTVKTASIVTALRETNEELAQIGKDLEREDEFSEIEAPDDIIGDIDSFTEEIKDKIDDLQSTVLERKDVGQRAAIIFFCFNSLFIVLALIFALLNVRCCAPYLILCFLFLVAFISWLLLFFFATGQILIEDFCLELKLTVEDPESSVIGTIIKCSDPELLDFDAVKDAVRSIEKDVAERLCEMPSTVSEGTFCEAFNCPSPLPTCTTIDEARAFLLPLQLHREVTRYGHTEELGPRLCPRDVGQEQCTVEECAADCVPYTATYNGIQVTYDLQIYADAMLRMMNVLQKVFDLLNDEIFPLLECKAIFDLLLSEPSDSCDDVSSAVKLVVAGYCLQSIAMLVAIVCCILGTKRWIALKETTPNAAVSGRKPSEDTPPKQVEEALPPAKDNDSNV